MIGLFSLRVQAIFFAMITLAVASAFQTLASQLSDFTGGEDGLTFKVPEALRPASSSSRRRSSASSIDGRLLSYYLLFVAALVLVLALLRIVNSPFGRVLQAIRENDFRAEAIGYRTVVYRTLASVLSALFATLAGALLALWLRYNGPDTTLSLRDHARRAADRRDRRHGHDLRRGRRRRAVRARAELPAGPAEARQRGASSGVPVLAALLSPDRWLLWLGVLFVLSVYYFPTGVVGRLRAAALHGPASQMNAHAISSHYLRPARAARSTTPSGARSTPRR